MLLDSALVFSSLVKVQVDWNNSQAIDMYIKNLETAVERLQKDNIFLTGIHQKLESKVCNFY